MPTSARIPELKDRLRKCCIDSLQHLYMEESGILAEGLRWDGSTYVATTPSVRDTANVLIALYRLQSQGVSIPLDADRLLARCVSDYLGAADFPEVALLLWADSSGSGNHLTKLWSELQQRLPDNASGTMLLSWTLSGVCEYFRAGGDRGPTERFARRLHDKIIGNQHSRTGLFFTSAAREGLLRRRRPTAGLPAQVFAIQALARYSETFNDRLAADRAVLCADRLCSLQGPQGQWWCVYDVREGKVVQEYPVYSVHQDGSMLTALSVIHRNDHDRRFEDAGNRGLLWVFGNNELKTSLVDDERAVVLRGIRREGNEFRIIREMRSYHPGRCLYALAISDSG